jgi:hypothetical protein
VVPLFASTENANNPAGLNAIETRRNVSSRSPT